MLAFCDYIADRIKVCLQYNDPHELLDSIGKVRPDLNEDGSFKSTRKALEVTDRNGKRYQVIVTEL